MYNLRFHRSQALNLFLFFQQKTAYDMRISDWSSDVCSSDLIAGYLDDPGVVEVMLNPDGRLWIDRLAGGLEDTGARINAADGERIVRLVAHHVGAEVHGGNPRVSAEQIGRAHV